MCTVGNCVVDIVLAGVGVARQMLTGACVMMFLMVAAGDYVESSAPITKSCCTNAACWHQHHEHHQPDLHTYPTISSNL